MCVCGLATVGVHPAIPMARTWLLPVAAAGAVAVAIYALKRMRGKLTYETLKAEDSTTTTAIIDAFCADQKFLALAKSETSAILKRDAEDDEKLAAGIKMAVEKGVLSANPPVEPLTTIDVLGKSAEQVTDVIINKLGDAPQKGCVFILQGLSGTGKGTTVAKLQSILPKAVSWSNGNVFRSLTLLAVTKCEQAGIAFGEAALTPKLLGECMTYLKFGKFKDGKFDIKIEGLGLNLLVSDVANTTLKEPKVGKNIPTVAKMTQGEVIKFAAGAAEHARGRVQCAHGGARTDPCLCAHAAPLRAHTERPEYHRHAACCAAHDGRGAQIPRCERHADPRWCARGAGVGARRDDEVSRDHTTVFTTRSLPAKCDHTPRAGLTGTAGRRPNVAVVAGLRGAQACTYLPQSTSRCHACAGQAGSCAANARGQFVGKSDLGD